MSGATAPSPAGFPAPGNVSGAGRPPLFLAALRLEALALRLGAARVEQQRIGMGPARAVAACARLSREADARPIVLIGCAGGLDPSLRPGDLVVASSVLEVGRDDAVGLAHGAEVADRLRAAPGVAGARVEVHLAPIVSSPRILHGDEARAAANLGGAVAVDMEARWCTPLARTRPFVVVRSILDVPGNDLFTLSTAAVALRCARSLAAAARALADWRPDRLASDTLTEIGEH